MASQGGHWDSPYMAWWVLRLLWQEQKILTECSECTADDIQWRFQCLMKPPESCPWWWRSCRGRCRPGGSCGHYSGWGIDNGQINIWQRSHGLGNPINQGYCLLTRWDSRLTGGPRNRAGDDAREVCVCAFDTDTLTKNMPGITRDGFISLSSVGWCYFMFFKSNYSILFIPKYCHIVDSWYLYIPRTVHLAAGNSRSLIISRAQGRHGMRLKQKTFNGIFFCHQGLQTCAYKI